MNREILQEKLRAGVKLWNDDPPNSDPVLEEMVTWIKAYLKKAPFDTEIWLKLALTEYCVPIADYRAVIDSLIKILCYAPNNIQVLLMLAYVQDHYYGITKDILDKLARAIPGDSQEEALILYVQTWYYRDQHEKATVEQLLHQSIGIYPKFVRQHEDLGELYKDRGELSDAYYHFKEALSNVQRVFGDEPSDILDINIFVDELVKGIAITDSNLRSIQRLYDECLLMNPSTPIY